MSRIETARLIMRHADSYKVCLGCESVIARYFQPVCRICGAYKFNENEHDIKHRAIEILKKDSKSN